MATLAETFCSVGARDGGGGAALEVTLEALVVRGRTAHPELTLEPARFVAHLARCGAAIDAPDVRAEDLFLACAAVGGEAAAVKKLQRDCRPALVKYLGRIDTTAAFLAEVEQQVWETLLVGRADGPPKLASYAGKGPLAGFVGITAQRLALTGLRKQSTEARAAAEAAAALNPALQNPELAYLKGRHQQDFHAAIRDALAVLGKRERLIYRMHLVDGLTVDRIAAAYDVSQSTVSRWLAKARATVIAEARRLLLERMQLSETDLEAILAQMLSQLDLSASQILGASPAGD
jgi:RNA polymerase sigma-70 factor, ECF subfamily